jgi:putative phage-type endonuclease
MGLTEEQQALRLTGVGASEVGSVVGADGAWESALTVWARKTQCLEKDENEVPEHVELGNLLEPVVASLYTRRTGRQLYEVGTLVHPKNPLLIATPDRLVKGERMGLQIKKVRTRAWDKWGDEGTDQCPENVICQVQYEMAVADLELEDVAVLFYGAKLAIYRIYRDEELIGLLADQVGRWWRDYVVTKKPPPPDGSDAAKATLASLFPQSNGKWIPLSPMGDAESRELYARVVQIAREYVQAREDEKAAKARKDEAGNQLRMLLGNAEGFSWPGGKVSNAMRKGVPLWKAIAEACNAGPKLIKEHTSESTRTLRVDLK